MLRSKSVYLGDALDCCEREKKPAVTQYVNRKGVKKERGKTLHLLGSAGPCSGPVCPVCPPQMNISTAFVLG